MAYKPKAGDVMSSPNVIPMADIMLVLLIIFMVVTPMLQKGVSVDMARVNNPTDMPNAEKDDAIIVAITRSGDIFLGSQKAARDQLTSLIRDKLTSRLDKTVFVRSDARAKYGDVVAGVDQLGLLTERSQEQRRTPPPPTQ